ncbi:hypothetical protein HMPREF1233_0112, partial [Streptococcus pyogenes GA19700]
MTPLVPGKEDPNRPLVELTQSKRHFGALSRPQGHQPDRRQ